MNSGALCKDARPCFARRETLEVGMYVCSALTSSYGEGLCPFCKPERDVTSGKRYPYNTKYQGDK